MLTASFMWILGILQLKAAFIGNAAWKLVSRTPEKVLNRSLEKMEIGDLDEEDSEESDFLYNFTLSIVSNFLMIIAEVILGAYLMYEHHSDASYYLAFALLYKNLILFAVFCTYKMKNNGMTLFESLNVIPKWAVTLERVSCLISAAIFGYLIWLRF